MPNIWHLAYLMVMLLCEKYNEKCYKNCGVGAQYNYNYEVINMIKLLPYEIVLLVENQ